MTAVVRLAPAKLNLTLAVLGRRADGFHDLHSVFLPLGLSDRLEVRVREPDAARTPSDSLTVDGLDAGPLADNLVLRAMALAREVVERATPGVSLPALEARLTKRIPVAAGLGGGSSDAAAAIDAAEAAWGVSLAAEVRSDLAARLGSDVPFFLVGAVALVEGRGERVTALPAPTGPPPGVLVVTPASALPTGTVFAAFDDGLVPPPDSRAGTRATSIHLAEELSRGLASEALVRRAGVCATANDLLPAAAGALPGLVELRRGLAKRLGRPVGLSGSGPSLWALYPSQADAVAAAELMRAAVASGDVRVPGDGPPSIIATTIGGAP
jgi:4-diphosphocytidyl-2-C-methyl-D-erythritol kinase